MAWNRRRKVGLGMARGTRMFINRLEELRLLEERYASDQAELFVLYGRRRVGKTELLTQFCRDKRHIFFAAPPLI